MIGALIGIVLTLVILGVVWWGIQEVMARFPIAEPFGTLVRVVIIIVAVVIAVWVIVQLLAVAGVHVPFPIH
jgi:uncharacterized membrane protein YwzB